MGNVRQGLVSLVVHLTILALMWSYHMSGPVKPQMVQVFSDIDELKPEENFIDNITDLDTEIDLSSAVAITPNSVSNVSQAVAAQPMTAMAASSQPLARLSNQGLMRPVAHFSQAFGMGNDLKGLAGSFDGGGGGDSGSVDRITLEIRRNLEKGRVLVAWVMDASGSLGLRREKVIARFDRINMEIKELKLDKDDAMLAGIVAFGKDTVFMTPEPTNDSEKLKKAVRGIKPDESGIENVFGAVKKTCLEWRKFQTHGKRKLMIVVLTDEIGDDIILMDDTIQVAKRQNASVYVMGPAAPFGRKEINVMWTDKPTGQTFQIPVERGPETLQAEHLRLPYWGGGGNEFELFSSGFGPYALCRIARETGGIYFIFDDGSIPGPKFNVNDMLEYRPDYLPLREYMKMMSEHPLRHAIIKAADVAKTIEGGTPRVTFPVASLNQAVTEGQRLPAKTLLFVNQALKDLRDAEKHRTKETSKRWQAHYDLMMGRLLAAKVRCEEYDWILAQMKVNPKTPTKKGSNAFRLVGDNKISFGQKEVADTKKSETNVRKSDPKATAKAKADADAAIAYLQRVVKDHPETPWAMMAQSELKTPLGFKWEETMVAEPGANRNNPPTPAEAEAAKKRAEAMKRIPKL